MDVLVTASDDRLIEGGDVRRPRLVHLPVSTFRGWIRPDICGFRPGSDADSQGPSLAPILERTLLRQAPEVGDVR